MHCVSYDVMIKEVLSESINGLAKKTILSRLKARWGVKDRFAKPAIESSLKRLRKGKKVKRCVNGFYRVSKKKAESSIDSSSVFGSSLISSPSSSNVSQKVKDNYTNKLLKEISKSASSSDSFSGESSDFDTDIESCCNEALPKSCSASPKFPRCKESDSLYRLEKDWEFYAEGKSPFKYGIREALLKCSGEGLTKDQLVYKIIAKQCKPETLDEHLSLKEKLDKAVDEMHRSGELIRCFETKKLTLQSTKRVLSVKMMRKFLKSSMAKGTHSKDDLLHLCLQHFSANTYQQVVNCFEECVNSFEDSDADGESDECSPCPSRKQEEKIKITCPCCKNDLLVSVKYQSY